MIKNLPLRKILPALVIFIALAARLIPGLRTIDDSFITYRYARNIIAGQGFVYNPGERVQGTTTPLYTLLMAGLGALGGGPTADFPAISLVVNIAADALTCLLLILLGRRFKAPWAGGLAALLWAVAPYSVTFAIGGLETSLYVLLLTASIYAYTQSSYTLTALLSALAILTRPDAVLLAAPLILDRLYRALRLKEKLRPAELLAFLLPTLGWALFALLYFGSPFPHSVAAKLAVYRLEPGSSLVRMLQHYADPFLLRPILGAAAPIAGLVLYPFLYLVGARSAWKIDKRLLAYLLYPWLYLLAFTLPNPLIFRWYLTPPLPPYFFFIILGAASIFNAAAARLKRLPPAAARAAAGVLLLLPFAAAFSSWTLHPDSGADRPAPQMAFIGMELLYRQAADIVRSATPSAGTIAAGDVGVLGYYSGARILDTVGLNSPESLRYYPIDPSTYVSNYAVPTALVLEQKPAWVVIMEIYGRRTLLQDPDFLKTYTLAETLPTDVFGSRGMLLFRRSSP